MTWKDEIKKDDKEVKRIIELLEQVQKGISNMMDGMSDDMQRFDNKTKPALKHVEKTIDLLEYVYDML